MQARGLKTAVAIAAVAALAVGAAGCAESERGDGGEADRRHLDLRGCR